MNALSYLTQVNHDDVIHAAKQIQMQTRCTWAKAMKAAKALLGA